VPAVPRVGDLEVGQDIAYSERGWRLQKAGWACLALLLAAGLAGLLGDGPLSERTVRDGDGLVVEYLRFARTSADTPLRVWVGEGAVPGGAARVWLDSAFLANQEIAGITPQPDRVEAGPDRLTYVFLAPDGGPIEVRLDLRPKAVGRHPVRVGVPSGRQVTFTQIVYP
jgi:hypothetical protein